MSFLKKLFGGGAAAPEKPAPTVEYKGYVIRATPVAEGGEWRVCGVILQEADGTVKEQVYHRADRMTSRDECVEITFQKGRQMIDDHRGRLFG